MKKSIKVAVYASGGGSNFEALLAKKEDGLLNVDFEYLLTNNSTCGAVEKAKSHGITVHHISSKTHPLESEFEQTQVELAKTVDVIVLAGYMKKIPKVLLENFKGDILNIHPALLPSFGGKGFYGMNVHRAVIESGVRYTGATVHLVQGEYDRGPILEQEIIRVEKEDTPENIATKVLEVEHAIYWRVLEGYATQGIDPDDKGRVWIKLP
jgi:formyltetrahydrofolate-dependent phosphoribosylglycinamide formyltransferase